MDIKIDVPKNKNGRFISKIYDKNGRHLRIKIQHAKFVSINTIPASGELIRFFFEDNNPFVSIIKNIDELAIKYIIKHNSKWFKNSLSAEQINDFFRTSLNIENQSMSVLLSKTNEALLVNNGNIIDNIRDVDFSQSDLMLEIEAYGFYFFKKKCGIRWILRKLSVENEKEEATDDWIDIEAIENQWDTDLQEFDTHIDSDIALMKNKITRMVALRDSIHAEYKMASSIKHKEAEWNQLLKDLSVKIAKYYDGMLQI
jgi:hypothetical protein